MTPATPARSTPAAALARRRRTLQTRCSIERDRVQANAQAWCAAARPAALVREARQALLHTLTRRPLQAIGLAALTALTVGAALAWWRAQGPQILTGKRGAAFGFLGRPWGARPGTSRPLGMLRTWAALARACRWGWWVWRMQGDRTRG